MALKVGDIAPRFSLESHLDCRISLSDYLVSEAEIMRRLEAVSGTDMVLVLFNPASSKRRHVLEAALETLRRFRREDTVVGVVRRAFQEEETVRLTTLRELDPSLVDMETLLVIGNSQSRVTGEKMITPRSERRGDES